jgi:hypothetical protein
MRYGEWVGKAPCRHRSLKLGVIRSLKLGVIRSLKLGATLAT